MRDEPPLPLEDLLAAPDRPLSAEELAELGPSPTDRHDGSTSGAIEVTDPEEDRLVADVDLRELELDRACPPHRRRAVWASMARLHHDARTGAPPRAVLARLGAEEPLDHDALLGRPVASWVLRGWIGSRAPRDLSLTSTSNARFAACRSRRTSHHPTKRQRSMAEPRPGRRVVSLCGVGSPGRSRAKSKTTVQRIAPGDRSRRRLGALRDAEALSGDGALSSCCHARAAGMAASPHRRERRPPCPGRAAEARGAAVGAAAAPRRSRR